jgi:hypothetical protein
MGVAIHLQDTAAAGAAASKSAIDYNRVKQWMFYKRDEANIRELKRNVLRTF